MLKDDGTLWLNIGDSYWGSGSRGTDFTKHDTWNGTINKGNRGTADLSLVPKLVGRFGDIKNKDMIGIPWMLAFALREDGWYLRQDIIWAKRNCMPESVTDRCTRSHEYVFLLSKKPKYYYDYKAIQEPTVTFDDTIQYDTRNKRDVWSIATVPFSGAHFATFPEELVKPCILAGSRTGDTVLDPFNGAGTTGVVCVKLGRNYVGTELNPEYVEMAEKRIADTRLELEYGIIAGQEKKDTFEYESSLFDEMSSETA